MKTKPLDRLLAASLPTWGGEFDNLGLISSYCIEVLEDAPLATRTLNCRQLPMDPLNIDANGIRLKPELLTTILKALYAPMQPTFPDEGLVVGIVLDDQFAPRSGAVVKTSNPCATAMPPTCFIKYLSADKLSMTTGTGTSSNGIWVSNAPYMSLFSATGQVSEVFGGIVEKKVTTVVLQDPTIGGM
jgi:hypothetical protein